MTSIPLDSFRRDRPLAESIAVATRSIHARLNKLIIERLPLALPPQTGDPFVYASGLLHIAPIYTTFESLWSGIAHSSLEYSEYSRDDWGGSKPSKPIVSDGLRKMLNVLYIPGLMRADRLVADIQSMTGWTDAATREQLEMISKTGHLAEVVSHIKRAIKNKPHVLLAYSYIMYMALFAGGRFIRATLESAGNDFWDTTASSAMPASRPSQDDFADGTQRHQTETSLRRSHGHLPLRFFHFDTPEDGEDLKRDYKQKLADCDATLNYQEKHDIVQEAICIFENLVLVVAQLDTVVAAGPIKPPADSPTSVESSATTIKHPLILPRFRDSVAVAKERSARISSNRVSGVSSGSGSDREDDPKSGESKTPAAHMPEEALPSEPHNHPTIPSTTDMELGPASSKSVRFEKTLPHPSRSDLGGVADSTADLTESLKMASKRFRREQVTNWVLGVAIGIIVVGVLFSGRRAASSEYIVDK